jgi:hypothetical protein
MLDADGVGESPRRAADALLFARGRVIAACSDALLHPRARELSFVGVNTGAGARGAGIERTGRTDIAAACARSRSWSGLRSGMLSMLRTLRRRCSAHDRRSRWRIQ